MKKSWINRKVIEFREKKKRIKTSNYKDFLYKAFFFFYQGFDTMQVCSNYRGIPSATGYDI